MRRAIALGLPLCAAACFVVGCDLQQLVLESEIAPGARNELVRDCCECLASGHTFLRFDACGGERPPDDEAETQADAGPLMRIPCLCGGAADTCTDVLVAGGVADVVGGCTAIGGMCQPACDGVLAYP